MSKAKTTPRGRNSETGRFTTLEVVRRHPSTHVKESVPKPGYGDTGRGKRK